MTGDLTGFPDGRDTLRTMGWEPLPYGCIAIVRKREVNERNTVWSWLVLVPWSDNAKPWIDGNEIFGPSLDTEAGQREKVMAKIRSLIDDRYGDTIADRAVDDLIQELFEDE